MLPDPTFAPPSAAELKDRIRKVTDRMEERGLDQLVCVDPDNILWLTNFANFIHERPFVLVVSRGGELRFVIPELERPHVRTRAVGEIELLPYFEFPAPEGQRWSDVFGGLFGKNDNVGIEHTCPYYVQAAVPAKTEASELVEEARHIKSDYEIARIRYACNIATDRIKALLAQAKPGQSALSVHSKAAKLATLKLLLDNPQLNMLATKITAVVQPPSVSHDPHNFTNVLDLGMEKGGPHVSIVAGVMNGYGCEVERTFFLGHVPEAARKPFDTMMQARRLAFEMTRPGNSMHDVDAAVNALIRKAGYGDALLHRTGHGIGVTGHEGPFLAEGYHHEIRTGMVFTIEPGIYLEGLGGFRHSDTVLVTGTGNVSLTPLPDSLEDMTLPVRGLSLLNLSGLQLPLMKLAARLNGIQSN
ncbi:MAG: Xaa-Pro dipeptidase [Maricaulis sp.]|jgi:Xaa-Pro dipeptidase